MGCKKEFIDNKWWIVDRDVDGNIQAKVEVLLSASEPVTMDRLTFVEKFTDAELEAIIESNNAKVKVFVKKLGLVNSVDTKKPTVVNAVNGLEALGLIGNGRAAEILG